jgi:hypothetical protein
MEPVGKALVVSGLAILAVVGLLVLFLLAVVIILLIILATFFSESAYTMTTVGACMNDVFKTY